MFKRDQSYFSIPRLIMLVIVFACLELQSSTVSQSQEHGAEEKPVSTLPREKKDASAATLLRKGAAKLDEKDFLSAIKIFREAVQLEPNNAAARCKLGDSYNANDEFDRAIVEYTEAIRLDADNGAAFLGRGVSYESKEEENKANADYARCIAACNRAIARNAMDADAYITRAFAHKYSGLNSHSVELQAKGINKALEDFTEAIRVAPTNAVAYYSRGCMYRLSASLPVTLKDGDFVPVKGNIDMAIKDWQMAKRLAPKYPDPFIAMGMMYAETGKYDMAIAEYTSAIRLTPLDGGAFWLRGESLQRKGLLDKAIADYTEVIRLRPKDAWAYYGRGECFYGKSDFDKAIADYTDAIRFDPKLEAAYDARGRAYTKKGQKVKAEEDFARAKSLRHEMGLEP